jgi:hypothetical protein
MAQVATAASCSASGEARSRAAIAAAWACRLSAASSSPQAAASRARPRSAAAPGLPASTTKSNSRTWRGRGVCDHFTQCAQVRDRSPWPLRQRSAATARPLADLVARDANEGDIRLLVTSIQTFHHWLRAQRLSWASRHAKVRRKGIGGAKRVDHGRLRALPVTSLVSDTRAGVGNRPHWIGGQPDVCAAGLRNASKNRTEETSMASIEQKRPAGKAAAKTMRGRGRRGLREAARRQAGCQAGRWSGGDRRPDRDLGAVPHRHPRRPRRLAGQAVAAVHPLSRGRQPERPVNLGTG